MEKLLHRTASRRSREQWQELVEQFEQSGLSRREFCDQNGVSYDRLAFWVRRFRNQDKGGRLFVEMPREIRDDLPLQTAWDTELDFGNGIVLRLRRN